MKKLLFFFGLLCMINLTFAQEMVTVHQNGHDFQVSAVRSVTDYPAENIQFWVGTGSNSVVAVFKWCQDETMGIAYGYRWDGSATIYDMLTGIAAADSRFTVTFNSSNTFINNLAYQDDTYNEYLETEGYCMYTFNGSMSAGLSDALSDNGYFELEEWGECYPFPSTTPIIAATDPNAPTDPVDASLPFSDILYWVGSGPDSAEFIVNFAQPDTAFAWGYLFNGSTTAQAMVDAIAAADPRFWTVGTPSYNGDIHFVLSNGDTLGLSPVDPNMGYNFWWTNLNGVSAGSGSASTLHNGDVFKYGDMNSAIGWDPLGTYFLEEAWVKTPTPVTPPTPVGPTDATIPATEIAYWVGTGNTEVVFVGNWCSPEVALAWGVRFDGTSTTVEAVMDTIAAYDSRFDYSGGGGIIYDVTYQDANYNLTMVQPTTGFIMYNVNGTLANFSYTEMYVSQGDLIKVGNTDCAVSTGDPADWTTWGYAWQTPIVSVTVPAVPVPDEATIAFSDILFWVGEGSNEAVMAVNWADTALAWGYRWDGAATVADMMNHIAAADPRFSFTGTGMVSDINYIDTAAGMTTPLGITPGNWWGSTNNGVMDMGMAQTLSNGDLEKWADSSTGILVDSVWVDEWGGYWNYIYVYPMTIYPVTVPDTTGGGTPPDPEHGPFCGGVGTDGCNAIAADDNQFVAWATSVVLTRGPQDISNPNSPLASFGDETNAIGPATPNNSMDAVSLGDGGSALVTFERPIQNGEGPDFAVFENDNNGGFLELAFVEVSSDGVHFVRFPATSLTQTETQTGSFAFTDPTFINNLAGKFQIGYGTPFDLEELADSANLNIDSIVYVRIIDVVGNIDPQYATYDAFGHIVNDPWPTDFASCGFDLTGVGVIHQKPVGIDNHEMPQVFAYPNPCNGTLYIINENAERVELYNVNGQLLEMVNSGDTHITLNMQSYPAGLYLLKVGNGVQKILKK